jgi:chloramphenicol 3-O-phosphotransferase
MNHPTPLGVVINGPSAVGKSILASAIQNHASVPILRFGIDELYRMVPDQWAGGVQHARFAARGFSYREVESIPGARRIVNGPDAIAMLLAMNAAIVAMLRAGVGVVVDGQAFEPVVNSDLERQLRHLDALGLAKVAIIELLADADSLVDRQKRHAHPSGLSLDQNTLPKQASRAEFVLDTSGLGPDEVAARTLKWLDDVHGESLHPIR